MREIKQSKFFTAFVKLTGYIPTWLLFKPRVILADGAKRRLPKASIMMANHYSLMDFALYLIVFPFRQIRFLMAEVLFKKGKLFSWFLYKLGGIFVDRDAFDFSFVGDSLEALEKGDTLGVFPQGRLPIGKTVFPFKPSITYIALHTDRPIIPIYSDGVSHPLKRTTVVIGKPIYIHEIFDTQDASQEKIKEITEYLEKECYALKECIKG